MDNNFRSFVHWGFQSLLLALCAWGVTELSSINKNIQDLNIKMAISMTLNNKMEDEIKDLKIKVQKLEDRK